MIFLLGGTSETAPLATRLAAMGYRVLVSTATDIPLHVGDHPHIGRRAGRLNEEAMIELLRSANAEAIVDATHPYASEAHATARRVAERMNVPYFGLVRPALIKAGEGIHFAGDHEAAARIAFSFGRPVLLTIGSQNLDPYVRESRRLNVPMAARVLSHPTSIEVCRLAGVPEEFIIAGRGPFSVEENRAAIRKFGIGVVVTKDSGDPGGAADKVEAARQEGCQLVVVERPTRLTDDTFDSIETLIHALSRRIRGT